MGRHSRKSREQARRLYLTGEAETVAEIARRLNVKAHTVGRWRAEEDWDSLRLKIDRQAAEKMAEKVASDRVALNAQHFKSWNVVATKLFESLQRGGPDSETIRNLDKVSGILDRVQKGQRLARGLSLDGKTEEQLRAEFEAQQRDLVDFFIEVVKSEVTDEQTRDRLARAILERLPTDQDLH